MGKKRDQILKVLTAGEGGVGKTTLLTRFVEGIFLENSKMTLGVEFFIKKLETGDTSVKMQLWDFGGQERFRFLLQTYARGASGALILFDLTRPGTLERTGEWVGICRSYADIPIVLVGTKLDKVDAPDLLDDLALEKVERYSLSGYLKVSSKTGQAIGEPFTLLYREVTERLELQASLRKRRGA
jgi:small GTP-binding protein